MNRKKLSRIALTVFPIFFAIISNLIVATPSANSKIADLEEIYEDSSVVEHNTLAAPLLLGDPALGGLRVTSKNLSFFDVPHTVGYKGNLLFEQSEDKGVRLQYRDLKEEAAFFWLFERSMDLKNRWVRMSYSGLLVPSRVALEFDHAESRADSNFNLYLDDSLTPQTVYFKLPDAAPFAEIETLRLVVSPEDLKGRSADFAVLDLELLPAGANPLGKAPSDLNRFDWYAEPLRAENQATFNTERTY